MGEQSDLLAVRHGLYEMKLSMQSEGVTEAAADPRVGWRPLNAFRKPFVSIHDYKRINMTKNILVCSPFSFLFFCEGLGRFHVACSVGRAEISQHTYYMEYGILLIYTKASQ